MMYCVCVGAGPIFAPGCFFLRQITGRRGTNDILNGVYVLVRPAAHGETSPHGPGSAHEVHQGEATLCDFDVGSIYILKLKLPVIDDMGRMNTTPQKVRSRSRSMRSHSYPNNRQQNQTWDS